MRKLYLLNKIVFITSSLFLIILIVISKLGSFEIFSLHLITESGCSEIKICGQVPTMGLLGITVFLFSISGIIFIAKNNKIKSKLVKTVWVVIAILLLTILFIVNLGIMECRPFNQRIKNDLKTIMTAQEMHYFDHNKYANNFDELKEYLPEAPYNPQTNQLYSDTDGNGLEGGDNDPETWLVQAFIPQPQYKYCKKISDGYWFICSQGGCYEKY